MGRSFITKRRSGGRAARSRAEPAAGGIPLASAAKRENGKNRFMSSRAVNASTAAASGTKFNDTIFFKRQSTRPAWEGEWDKNSRVRVFFFSQLCFFLFQTREVSSYNYLLLCVKTLIRLSLEFGPERRVKCQRRWCVKRKEKKKL